MTPTTTHALFEAIRDAIQGITPRFAFERVSTWQYTPGPRERGTALHIRGTALRSFDLVFDPAARTSNWYGNGHAYSCRLRICTSYRDVEPSLRDHMISEDGVSLDRTLRQLSEPTVPGFGYAEYQRTGQTFLDDQSNAMVEHVFILHYSQDTT